MLHDSHAKLGLSFGSLEDPPMVELFVFQEQLIACKMNIKPSRINICLQTFKDSLTGNWYRSVDIRIL